MNEDRNKILVIGATGAIGQKLLEGLIRSFGPHTVIAAIHRTPLPDHIQDHVIVESGFNIRNEESIRQLFAKHGSSIQHVWNLAAPLSVDTAKDPSSAHDITVGGMQRVLSCMLEYGVTSILFSDSIGSFGGSSPRENATAVWLEENPTQDPGSDYGIQKRQCREAMQHYAENHGFRARYAIIPGVLHTQPSWGGGTTEYALDAMAAAVAKQHYVCPVPLHVPLPMIHIDDLISGMIALMQCGCKEKYRGYALAGFSFTPLELFTELQKHYPNFTYEHDEAANPNVAKFAELWPDSLSTSEAQSGINHCAQHNLASTVADIISAHQGRLG